MLYLGIDPGQSGGIASIGGRSGKVFAIEPMPPTEKGVWDFLRDISQSFIDGVTAVIEHVHAMPQQGVTSMFTFGMGYGGLRMALIGNGIPFEEIRPHTWQKSFEIPSRKKKVKGVGGESKTEWKTRLLRKAQQLFPKEEITRDLADALLLAEYCRRSHIKAKE